MLHDAIISAGRNVWSARGPHAVASSRLGMLGIATAVGSITVAARPPTTLAPVHAAAGLVRGRAAGDRARRGLAPDRRRRAPLPRRRLLAVVQRPRPSPPRDRRRRVREQLDRVAHSTMLGLSHPGAAELAARLVELAPPGLTRVFYSDSGSTAVEIALKMAFQYRQQRGGQHARRTSFVHLRDAYHGDTIGSVSVGGIDLFHATYRPLLVRDPRRRARRRRRPRARSSPLHEEEVAAVIVEPLVQGAAGMIVHPPGYLRAVRELCDRHGVLLICDEVATGFGRTGTMFACEQERVAPDFLCLAKGLTGGYLPLAATLTTERDLRGLPRRARGAAHLLPRPHLHRQPARLRRGAGQPRRLRAGADDRAPAAEDPPVRRTAGRGGRDARGRRGARPRLHGRHRPRRARSRRSDSAIG